MKNFLQAQETYSLHKLPRRNFSRRRVVVGGPFEQWQADLVDMTQHQNENRGYKWILVMIDVFSKKAYAVPVKTKENTQIIQALKSVFDDLAENDLPKKLHTDKGFEFRGRLVINYLKSKGIKWFSTEDDVTKASIVERLNRTLKQKMYRAFTAEGNQKWLELLPRLVEGYNSTIHSSIKTTPNEAHCHDSDMISFVRNSLYGPGNRLDEKVNKEVTHPSADHVQEGDYVRLKKSKMIFMKSYLPNYTREIFVVKQVLNTQPQTYIVLDLRHESIKGVFYPHEVQKVKKPKVYEIEEVLKEQGNRVLVKWRGYGPKFNQWISRRYMTKYKR